MTILEVLQRGVSYLKRFYLTPARWPVRLAVHRIGSRDDDRAPHSHPFSFFTLPLGRGYWEAVFDREKFQELRYVRPWRLHWRGREFVHQIVGLGPDAANFSEDQRPTWTLVLMFGKKGADWGFWLADGTYVPHEEYRDAGEIRNG